MARPGRAPKPTVIEIAEGFPGKRALNRLEPKPGEMGVQEARDSCPEHLPEQYQKWWAYYAPILASIRVLTEADLVTLEKLARTTGERVEQEEALLKAGPLYKSSKTDYIQVSPIFSIVQKLRTEELKLLREFGMTPSSRTRVNVAGPIDAVDPIEMAMG
jgi:P27 family predicted phage terminase small subunit